MPRRPRPRTTTPDPQLVLELASCLRDSPHLHTLIGLMQIRGVDLVPVSGRTDHGVPWAAIVVQGADESGLLASVAERVAAALDAERHRLRLIAERG